MLPPTMTTFFAASPPCLFHMSITLTHYLLCILKSPIKVLKRMSPTGRTLLCLRSGKVYRGSPHSKISSKLCMGTKNRVQLSRPPNNLKRGIMAFRPFLWCYYDLPCLACLPYQLFTTDCGAITLVIMGEFSLWICRDFRNIILHALYSALDIDDQPQRCHFLEKRPVVM